MNSIAALARLIESFVAYRLRVAGRQMLLS